MEVGDEILEGPPSGQGAGLKIRYKLPKRKNVIAKLSNDEIAGKIELANIT